MFDKEWKFGERGVKIIKNGWGVIEVAGKIMYGVWLREINGVR